MTRMADRNIRRQGMGVPRVLRRFEIYTMARRVPPGQECSQLEEAFRRCGDFIPEMTHSVVGKNLPTSTSTWCGSTAMSHRRRTSATWSIPFHANILDRYLLNDCPERIVGNSPLGDGTLVGYSCDGPVYLMHDGMRKVVLFGLEGPTTEQEAFIESLRGLAGSEDGVVLSVVEPNTFGVAWFDGVTPMLPPSQWTHVWELGFVSAEAYDEYQRAPSPLARAEAAGWKGEGSEVVRQAVEMHYAVKL